MTYNRFDNDHELLELKQANSKIKPQENWIDFMNYSLDRNMDDLEVIYLKRMAKMARGILNNPPKYSVGKSRY